LVSNFTLICELVVLVTILSEIPRRAEEMKKLYGYLLEERGTAG
jgi:hypothetical protein